MTQDEKFLRSIHIVPDITPVGKRTRETSREWIGTSGPEPTLEPESTIYEQLLADLKLRQVDCGSGPGLTTEPVPAPVVSTDAHSFSVTLSYAEWVAVVAAIESTVAKMDIRRPEAAEVATRLYQAYMKISAAASGG
jgi:hypothetical protein